MFLVVKAVPLCVGIVGESGLAGGDAGLSNGQFEEASM
jgi:hypothetical protein